VGEATEHSILQRFPKWKTLSEGGGVKIYRWVTKICADKNVYLILAIKGHIKIEDNTQLNRKLTVLVLLKFDINDFLKFKNNI
jgi:hypothetical protein